MANQNNQQQNIQAQQQPRSEETQPAAQQQAQRPGGEKRFRVKEEARVARGGSFYTLPKGKTISTFGYDIQALKNQGVQLEEVA